jgi:hypothetical protein
MSKDFYDDVPNKWFTLHKEGEDWTIYNPDGNKAQTFTVARLGSSKRAKAEAERELANRNRRLKRLRDRKR